jgi:hypothetical protein
MEIKKSTNLTQPEQSIMLDDPTKSPSTKKKRKRFGEDFETGNLSDEYDDELNKYLNHRIDIKSIDDDPSKFWYEHRSTHPFLLKLARSIFSIPASTANVERQFSAGGLMVNSRRTRLNPQQVNNALFIRSVKKIRDGSLFIFLSFYIFFLYSLVPVELYLLDIMK